MKQKIIPIASIIVGLIAFFLTGHYLRSQKRSLNAQWAELNKAREKVEVLKAARNIPLGTAIVAGDLKGEWVFKQVAGRQGVRKGEVLQVLGRRTLFKIDRDDMLTWEDIEGGSDRGVGLAPIIKSGMRAISLSVGGSAAVSGMVRPNDHIDVLGTFAFPSTTVPGEMEAVTLTVLQDVTVLACGQRLAKQSYGGVRQSAGSYSSVTLQVTPREAELLVFAQQTNGRLTLALRNPSDVSFEKDLPNVNFDHLQSKLPEINLYRQRHIRKKTNL